MKILVLPLSNTNARSQIMNNNIKIISTCVVAFTKTLCHHSGSGMRMLMKGEREYMMDD